MAIYSGILRGMNGSAGALKFVQTGGVTIVSEKQTKVKNPRTWAQQVQRARWINAVALGRIIAGSRFKFAFEKAEGLVSDINCFMREYMAKFQTVNDTPWLCKEMSDNGLVIPCPCFVSSGSLDPVTLMYDNSEKAFRTNFNCSVRILSDTTVAQLSKALVGENASLEYGDKLTYLMMIGRDTEDGFRYTTQAVAMRLDETDETKVMALTTRWKQNEDEEILTLTSDANGCAAVVVTRKRGDKILASNSLLTLANNADQYYHEYTGQARLAHAVEDLGGYSRTLLNPGSGSQKG